MDILVKDTTFKSVYILDIAQSIIWTERYKEVSDFEMYVPLNDNNLFYLREDYYLIHPNSSKVMIIEQVSVKTHDDYGRTLLVKGRSLESILERRIVLRQILLDGGFQSSVKQLITDNAINSIYPERNITRLNFIDSTDSKILALTLKGQFYSENLLDLLLNLLVEEDLGFKISLTENNMFEFMLFFGVDRSYSQVSTNNPFVVFTPEYDNLANSNYTYTNRYKKTYTLVSGDRRYLDGNGLPMRQQVWLGGTNTFDLERREMFSDANDLSRLNESTNSLIPDTAYIDQLKKRGELELSLNSEMTFFDGQVKLDDSYKYNVDFFLGDIIQLDDGIGHVSKVRVEEMILNENINGYEYYPTLTTL